ncbi:MAG: DUF4160 domain-containing protein [Kineothrix sp.]
MPEISTFYGISIRMFNKDHQPPHFHATSGNVGNQTAEQKVATP